MENNTFDIANYIISRCTNTTNMKLQKLVYYAHIQFLLQNSGRPLINDDIEAWVYGPVIPTLYREFSKFSYKPISEVSKKGDINNLNDNQKKAIDDILALYGNKDAGYLSDKTHSEDPWQDAYQSTDWSENIITNESLIEYYTNNPLV